MGAVYLAVPVSMASIALFEILRLLEVAAGGSYRSAEGMAFTKPSEEGQPC
jgi:TRAP-type C4-dicarboxylate transport system permease small subunit